MLIFLVDRGLGADDGCRTVLDGVSCHDVPVKRFQSFREGGIIIGEFMYEVFKVGTGPIDGAPSLVEFVNIR
mgnify:FL=1